ncbi:MAG: hypothetical protein KF842_12075 [Caulobacter sp.]|nr:hypothetical protein [Caulobacter sp.]
MTLTPPPDPARAGTEPPAGLAARRFTQALAWTRLLDVTARVEATLSAAGSLEDLFALEEGLTRAWPSREGRRAPAREMMWAGGSAGLAAQDVRLAAFDEAGRVLLRRTYLAGSGGHG